MKNVITSNETSRRTVGRRTVEGREAKVVTISRSYRTSAEDLWEACTDPRRIPRWFLPVEGDLEVGGRYQLQATPVARSSPANRPGRSRPPGNSRVR